jgi:tetratricopeptide (TPR) repeat protein
MKKRPRIQKLTAEEQSLFAEAQRLFDGGHLIPAAQKCESLISAKPRAPQPLLLKAWIHLQTGDFFAAQQSVGMAALLLPTDPGVQAWAAEICSEAGDLNTAQKFEEQAVRLGDRGPSVLRSLAASYTNAERYADALPCYQQLLALEPWNAGNCMNVAYSAGYIGNMALARASLLQVLSDNPKHFQAQFALSQLQTVNDQENNIETLEASLAKHRDDGQAKAFLGYALGKEYEDLGDFQQSFQYYRLGADAVIESRSQPSGETAIINRVYQQFSAMPAPEVGSLGKGMIFVVGLPRTGTTLLDRILGAHDQIQNAGELRAFPFSCHRSRGLTVRASMSRELLDSLNELNYGALGQSYLDCLPKSLMRSGYVTDKNPINFLYAGLIARALPGAVIVSVRRSAMDSCFSNFKQLFAPGAYMHSYDMQEMADYYSAYASLMDLWKGSLGERYVEVHYEDVIADHEREVKSILATCGLSWEKPMDVFYERPASVGSASFAQVRQPVYASSVAKWRHFEDNLAPLKQALLAKGIPESVLST